MSQLRLIKASAGSGKTFRLTSEYLKLLFKYPLNFRHILGVTFTNKATEEMKGRILLELFKLANDKPSKHYKTITGEFNLSGEEIRKNAQNILNHILHNYSRFSISTIDSFFQRIIKSFAREAGIQFNYEIEMDTDSVLEKAASQMVNNVGADNELLEWLAEFAEDRIEDGKGWDFQKDIVTMGKQLFNESFKLFPPSFHQKIADRKFLTEYHGKLYAVKISYENKLKSISNDALAIMKKYNLTVDSFKWGKSSGVGAFLTKLPQNKKGEISNRIREMIEDIGEWAKSDSPQYDEVMSSANDGLESLLKEAVAFIDETLITYNSCNAILRNFYTLGLLSDLTKEVKEYSQKNNVFLLANSAVFLKSIIGENDVPFIYEKTGQTYYHYMIDEFQDTSVVQWSNFQPLFANCLASNNIGLLVGDVKQSIYRWRNTDWKVMAYKVEEDIKSFGVKNENLQYNYRSKQNIVAFNNSFFDCAAKVLQDYFNENIATTSIQPDEKDFLSKLITSAYEGCMQMLPNAAEKKGKVKIVFPQPGEVNDNETIFGQLVDEILALKKQGHKFRDMAVLVRRVREGRDFIEYINKYNAGQVDKSLYISVLSNESALIFNSVAISFLLEIYCFLVFPDNEVNKEALIRDWQRIEQERARLTGKQAFIFENDKTTNDNALQNQIGRIFQKLPKEFTSIINELSFLPPDELFERAVLLFKLNELEHYLPYLQAFHDCVLTFMAGLVTHIAAFLEYWEDNKYKVSLSVSESQDAIKVMTVHKSKGLQFSNVFVPFCNWKIDHESTKLPYIWCSTDAEPFNQLENIPVKYSSSLKESLFAYPYFLEKGQAYVDSLNVLYVAFTRAADNLIVFADVPGKDGKNNNVGQLLFNVLSNNNAIGVGDYPQLNFRQNMNLKPLGFEVGEIETSDFEDEKDNVEEIPLRKYPVNSIGEKLKQHPVIKGFWEDKPDKFGGRKHGNLMHYAFQNIKTVEDIPDVVANLILEGYIKKDESDIYLKQIEASIKKEPFKNWFSNKWKIFTETAIIVPNEHIYRPDRVMVCDNNAIVVDYKFGSKENKKYIDQVKSYMFYLKEMGYSKIEGYVWYVYLDKLVDVIMTDDK